MQRDSLQAEMICKNGGHERLYLIRTLVQSSSAVTVVAIGFVNAGLLNHSQAVWVLFGANVGTTMTGWEVARACMVAADAAVVTAMMILAAGKLADSKGSPLNWAKLIAEREYRHGETFP